MVMWREMVLLVMFLLFVVQQICATHEREKTMDCPTSSCGKITNISRPFRLKRDPIHCGDSRYELDCENNVTVLYLFSGKYHVQAINYHNFTIRVVDPGVEEPSCSSLPRYFLSKSNFTDAYHGHAVAPYLTSQYQISDELSNYEKSLWKHIIYLNCSHPVSEKNKYVNAAPCVKWQSKGHIYAIGGDITAAELEVGCGVKLVSPTSWWGLDESSYTDMNRALLYGFEMSWLQFACDDQCQESPYDVCSFNTSSLNLQCALLCPDIFGIRLVRCGRGIWSQLLPYPAYFLENVFFNHLKMKKIPTNKNSSSAAYPPSHSGILKMKFANSSKSKSETQVSSNPSRPSTHPYKPGLETSNPKGIPSSFPHPPPSAPQEGTKHAHPTPPTTSLPPSTASQSRTLKVRICSKSHTNSAPTFIVQPPIAPQSDSQPPHQHVHVPAPTIPGISDVYSENEEEEDEEAEMQVHQQRPPTRKRAWLVDITDEQGKRNTKQLRTNDVWHLPPNERILVKWNNEGQPIADGGALLNRFLGSIARNHNAFPISYSSWRKIPKVYKEDILKNTIQAKFDIHSDVHINHVLKSLNTKWRDHRQELWHQRNDGTRTRDELIAMAPEGINRDHWALFVDYRLNSKTKENALKNKENRTKQTIAHTGGSKTIARKRDEMEKECGHKVSRGDIWIATHKHANGAFVSDEAKEIGEKIEAFELTSSSLISKEISTTDSLACVFGSREHCGRVRGLGLGPYPSKVFGCNAHSCSGSSSNTDLQNQVHY